MKRSGAALKN